MQGPVGNGGASSPAASTRCRRSQRDSIPRPMMLQRHVSQGQEAKEDQTLEEDINAINHRHIYPFWNGRSMAEREYRDDGSRSGNIRRQPTGNGLFEIGNDRA